MKAVSRKNITFPSLGFAMKAGRATELPDDKDAQKAILASPYVSTAKKETSDKDKAGDKK